MNVIKDEFDNFKEKFAKITYINFLIKEVRAGSWRIIPDLT
jgi:hypothetical protein